MFVGNFNGFTVYDIENGSKPKLLSSVVCPGGQGDVSVYRNLLIVSVEQTRGRVDCGTGGVKETVSAERFRGIRIFDISDLASRSKWPLCRRCRGSHTHTLVTDPKTRQHLRLRSRAPARCARRRARGLLGEGSERDPNTSLFSIDVIQVPLNRPSAPHRQPPRIFADPTTARIAGLWQGGNTVRARRPRASRDQCHDITVFPDIGLAAGACSGNGILLDISDPRTRSARCGHRQELRLLAFGDVQQRRHQVIFTDEWGGGTRRAAAPTDPLTGAPTRSSTSSIASCVRGYYKMPAPQTELGELRRAQRIDHPGAGPRHHGAGVVSGRLSVFDFTDRQPVEIAFFDRGRSTPRPDHSAATGRPTGTTATSTVRDRRGIDIFSLTPSEFLSQNEIEAARLCEHERSQRTAAASSHMAAELRGVAGVRRSAHARPRHPTCASRCDPDHTRTRRQDSIVATARGCGGR
jgi:hypothetical protein